LKMKFFRSLVRNAGKMIGVYLNRLSDWLYTAARTITFITKSKEILAKS
jgi:cob(I)alamin adenosyltransferase